MYALAWSESLYSNCEIKIKIHCSANKKNFKSKSHSACIKLFTNYKNKFIPTVNILGTSIALDV